MSFGGFVAMQLVPCTHSTAQEELHLSSKINWCSILLKVKLTYWEWQFIRVCCQHIVQQLEISLGAKTYFQERWFQECFHVFRTTLLLLD
jgi:hypothetical protein